MNTIWRKIKSSNLIKDSASYTLLNIIEKVIPFLLLPLITRVLPKDEVGLYVLYQSVISVMIPLFTLNIDSSVLLNFYKFRKVEFKAYFSNSILLFIAFYINFLILFFFISDFISDALGISVFWLLVISSIVFVRFFTQLRQHLWRINFKIKQYGFFTVGISILKNGLGLILLFTTDLGWKALVLGHLSGYIVFALLAIVSFIHEDLFNLKLRVEYLKDAFNIGYPLALHKTGLWLGDTANRVIIAAILGASATANYGIGATFAMIVMITEDAFTKAFVPHLFEELKKSENMNRKYIVRLSYSVYLFLIMISMVTLVVGYFSVGLIFGDDYNSTRIFIAPLVIAAMVKGFYKLHVNYILFTKKTLHITKITITTGLLNLILAYFMTIRFGLIGTAFSLLIINFIQYIFSFYVGNKLIPMPWLSVLLKKK